jgi:ribosomal protein L37AE/L43A
MENSEMDKSTSNAIHRLVRKMRSYETMLSGVSMRVYEQEEIIERLEYIIEHKETEEKLEKNARLGKVLKMVGVPVKKDDDFRLEVQKCQEPPCPVCGKELEDKMTVQGNAKLLIWRCYACDAMYKLDDDLELVKWVEFSR